MEQVQTAAQKAEDGPAEVRWSPRVKKELIRRLYENDAAGIVDEELIDEVGCALYARCRSILNVRAARQGQIRCPRCDRQGSETVIDRKHGFESVLLCPTCGWQTTWRNYSRTFKRRQLHSGGAVAAFEGFLKAFDRARTPREKVLAIDRVIHEFHYSLQTNPDLPTRAAGVNLIAGTLTEVMTFLDDLTYGTPETRATRAAYQARVQRLPWNPVHGG